ncbi:MAG: BTAD domain-containing putative transcriptional regulator [Sphingomonadaceae bacterium]
MAAVAGLVKARLLGGFRLLDGDGNAITISGKRARALLAYLTLATDLSASRAVLAPLLWNDRGDDQARSSLRQCLVELKTSLGIGYSHLVIASRSSVSLAAGFIVSDVAEIDAILHGDDADAAIDRITALGRTQLLDDLDLSGPFAAWRAQDQVRIERQLAAGVAAQMDRLEHLHDWPRIAALADAWGARAPHDEAVVATAIRADIASGAEASAHRRYQNLKAALASDIGVEPGDAVRAAIGDVGGVTTASNPVGQPVLAVLAFDNLSSDAEMEYFSEGVSEEILLTVSRTLALRVIGRASSFQFRGRDKISTKIAARLGTTHLLDGSVRRSGDQVRITASLVECAGQTTLWSGRFDRSLANIFAVQDEIATSVAQELNLIFAPASGRDAIDPQAYDLYLRARRLASSPAHVAQCIALLEEAVARAPDFALAWGSLAMGRAIKVRWMVAHDQFEAEREQALLATARATALDPTSGLPLVAISLLEPDGRFAVREGLLDQAMMQTPDDPEILKQVSDFSGSVGRMQVSYSYMRRAAAIDPLNPQIIRHCIAHQFDPENRAPFYEKIIAMRAQWPDYDWATGIAILYAASFGDWAIVDDLLPVGGQSREWNMAVAAAADLRKPLLQLQSEALESANRQIARRGSIELRTMVRLYNSGLRDDAFAAWDRSQYDYRFSYRPDTVFLLSMIFDVFNADMRKDVRFVDLCARLGLCDYWVNSGRWPDCVAEVAPYYDLKSEACARV